MRAGGPYPLGATFDGLGTNFSVFSRVAERVELCLFDDEGRESRVDLPEMTGYSWHGYLPRIGPGQRYGYRIHGPWDPGSGRRCNSQKLLLDPYARAIDGAIEWGPAIFGHDVAAPARRNEVDSAPYVPRSVIVRDDFDWRDDARPRVPDHDTILYEVHVKGFTMRHPGVPAAIRGTYAGLAHPAAIEHLRSLGVTSVELLPIHHFLHDGFLLHRGLRNYWGYNSIGYFAPHAEYAAAGSGRWAGPRVQGHGQGPPRGRPGGHPRRRLQPHRRGRPRWPDALAARSRQPGLLPAAGSRPQSLHGLHGHGQLAQHARATRAAAHHGQPALLDRRDARRWLPLRPGLRPGPRAARRGPPVGLLRHHPAGPRHPNRQAHRRALGRR